MRGRKGGEEKGGGWRRVWFSVELGVCCFSLRVFLGGGLAGGVGELITYMSKVSCGVELPNIHQPILHGMGG